MKCLLQKDRTGLIRRQWNGVLYPFLAFHHFANAGTLVNDEVKILAEVDVLESIDKLYIPRKFEKTTIPQSKIDEKYAAVYRVLLKEPSAIKSMDSKSMDSKFFLHK